MEEMREENKKQNKGLPWGEKNDLRNDRNQKQNKSKIR